MRVPRIDSIPAMACIAAGCVFAFFAQAAKAAPHAGGEFGPPQGEPIPIHAALNSPRGWWATATPTIYR